MDAPNYRSLLLKHHWMNGVLCLLMLGLSIGLPQERLWLDQHLTMNGQWWRLLTGHLVHSNSTHLLMNLSVFLLVIFCFENIGSWIKNTLVIVFISLGLSFYLLSFTDHHYLGFSGTLHGYLVYCLISDLTANQKANGFMLGLIALKLLTETLNIPIDGGLTASLIGTPIAYSSHLMGACLGALFGLVNLFHKS